jgi:hypothetical protein
MLTNVVAIVNWMKILSYGCGIGCAQEFLIEALHVPGDFCGCPFHANKDYQSPKQSGKLNECAGLCYRIVCKIID